MEPQQLWNSLIPLMSDPEWIALESLDERTTRFIFDDTMLHTLRQRGLAEPKDEGWRVTPHGRKALSERATG